MDFTDAVCDISRRESPSHSPARDGICFRDGVNGDSTFRHSFKGGDGNVLLAIIEYMFVDLICDCYAIPLYAQTSNFLEFSSGKDLACRIVGSIDDYRFCVYIECLRQFFIVIDPFRRYQRNISSQGP